MKKLIAVIAALGVAAVLAGCSSAAPAPVVTVTVTATPDASAGRVASTPTAGTEADANFIAAARYSWRGDQLTDAQYLAYRDAACAALKAGTPYDQVVVAPVGTEDEIWNNGKIVFYATQVQCTEFARK